MRVRIVGFKGAGFAIKGGTVQSGDVVDLDDSEARMRININQAEAVDESTPLTERKDPEPKPVVALPPDKGVVDPTHVLHKPEPVKPEKK